MDIRRKAALGGLWGHWESPRTCGMSSRDDLLSTDNRWLTQIEWIAPGRPHEHLSPGIFTAPGFGQPALKITEMQDFQSSVGSVHKSLANVHRSCTIHFIDSPLPISITPPPLFHARPHYTRSEGYEGSQTKSESRKIRFRPKMKLL